MPETANLQGGKKTKRRIRLGPPEPTLPACAGPSSMQLPYRQQKLDVRTVNGSLNAKLKSAKVVLVSGFLQQALNEFLNVAYDNA
ncbi:hypothetical protein [Pseudorhizobium pelagicum]|uniref:hypothetical protein n=1 Tax=Pseudorhizobium pelagicum TaxID=1509405 RepID=UPI0011114380|nr:hypothetical protein [Pseudorhizobium pelagicum]